jgi:hypothetical protein
VIEHAEHHAGCNEGGRAGGVGRDLDGYRSGHQRAQPDQYDDEPDAFAVVDIAMT